MARLLDYLLIIIGILYILKALVRYLLPMLFQSVINKAQEQSQNQQYQNQQRNYSNQKPPEAKVKVDYIPESHKAKVPDSEGDFIDYEEIK